MHGHVSKYKNKHIGNSSLKLYFVDHHFKCLLYQVKILDFEEGDNVKECIFASFQKHVRELKKRRLNIFLVKFSPNPFSLE